MQKYYYHSHSSQIFAILVCLLVLCQLGIFAKTNSKPQWVSKGETILNDRRSNDTYYFKVIRNIGPDLLSLRSANANALADYIGKRNHVKGLSVTELKNTQTNGGVSTSEQFNMVFRNEFSSDAFYAALVDEYWEREGGFGDYHYYALFAVSADGNRQPVLDRFEVTRSYGAVPALMSVIPGVGQLYKGQKLKGCLMLGGAAVGVGAIVLTENRRSYYETRIAEEPKFARDHSKKRDNWETGRNIAIGATAALMVWSIIDAAVAPGVTRVRISPATSLALHPAAITTPTGTGIGASLAFNF